MTKPRKPITPEQLARVRKAFEKWVSEPPREFDFRRNSVTPDVSAWPGQYTDDKVNLAWEAWCEAVGVALNLEMVGIHD